MLNGIRKQGERVHGQRSIKELGKTMGRATWADPPAQKNLLPSFKECE